MFSAQAENSILGMADIQNTTSTARASSVTVNVEVMAQRHATGHSCKVTTAELVMVAMGPEGKPRPYSDVDPFEEPPATDGGSGR